jgi:hypothetical protein
MVLVAYPDGSTIFDYPLIEENVVTHLAQRIVVDSGAIKIDSAPHNVDRSHIVLDGVLAEGEDYIKVTKSAQTLVNIDYQGVVNTHKMSTNLIDVKQSVDLYGDAAIQYVPQTSQFQNVPGYTYRFGKNQQELGDFSSQGDGLEFRNMPWGGNEILMQVNDITPTIEIRRLKNPGVETLVVTSERQSEQDPGNKIITIDDAGLHVRRNDRNINLMIPGNALSVGLLTQGFQTHKFTLDQAWTSESTETEIEIYSATSAAEFLHIQNVEVTLDDRSQPSSVSEANARVYVKRWGVYRNTYLRLWLVLGVDLRGDSSVATGRYLRVSFNNKLIL